MSFGWDKKKSKSSFLVVKDPQAFFERRCWLNHILLYLHQDVFIQHCAAPCHTAKQCNSSWVYWENTFSAVAHFQMETVNLPQAVAESCWLLLEMMVQVANPQGYLYTDCQPVQNLIICSVIMSFWNKNISYELHVPYTFKAQEEERYSCPFTGAEQYMLRVACIFCSSSHMLKSGIFICKVYSKIPRAQRKHIQSLLLFTSSFCQQSPNNEKRAKNAFEQVVNWNWSWDLQRYKFILFYYLP